MNNINLLLILAFIVCSGIPISFVSQKNRWKILLSTSLCFLYFLIGLKLFILIILAAIVYGTSFLINKKKIKLWIIISILLIPLLVLKASISGNHFENYHTTDLHIFDWFHWANIFQIIGLSYFTFNGISYLIDLKRKYVVQEKNFFLLLLYLIYFPIIFSGPLHRAKYIFKQFKNIEINNSNISRGLRLILWGLFKNMVVAQRIYILLSEQLINQINGVYYLLVGFAFFLYLYCNFSSFIDFFQGVSQIFGIRLKDNFKNNTYLSSSRQEFWKGWHISLNEWFRDYFFFVIIKYDKKRKYTSIFLLFTFLLIALWHELTLSLLIWGTLNGLWIILEKKVDFKEWSYPNLRKYGGIIYHLFFSSILAIVFISPNFVTLVQKITSSPSFIDQELIKSQLFNLVIVAIAFMVMHYHNVKSKNNRFDHYLENKSLLKRWSIYFQLTLMILVFGIAAGVNNYYIQF